jgi:hypothetical protein
MRIPLYCWYIKDKYAKFDFSSSNSMTDSGVIIGGIFRLVSADPNAAAILSPKKEKLRKEEELKSEN